MEKWKIAAALIIVYLVMAAFTHIQSGFDEKKMELSETSGKGELEVEVKGKTLTHNKTFELTKDVESRALFLATAENPALNYQVYANGKEKYSSQVEGSTIIRNRIVLNNTGDSWNWYFEAPDIVDCHPRPPLVDWYTNSLDFLEVVNTFPFQSCGFKVPASPEMAFNHSVSATVTVPDTYAVQEDISYLECPIVENKSIGSIASKREVTNYSRIHPEVRLKNSKEKIAVFESILARQETNTLEGLDNLSRSNRSVQVRNSYTCNINMIFYPSSLIVFIFLISASAIFFMVRNGLNNEDARLQSLALCFTIWIFQEALLPFSGISRPLEVTLYDLTIVLSISLWFSRAQRRTIIDRFHSFLGKKD